MSARPDILAGHGIAPRNGIPSKGAYRSLTAGAHSREPFQHVVSLGPRCTNASSVYKAQRGYAGPFDWIFSSARMVTDCVRDRFDSFLDQRALYEVGKAFDAIGLPSGSAARERTLVGHSRYSEMTEGVGRGVIFNHHNPLTDEGHAYIQRCVNRFLCVLELNVRKLYTFINIDRKLWKLDDIYCLFEELSQRDGGSFVMLVVNCVKHCGEGAKQVEPRELERREAGRGLLQVLEVQCVGENTGSYFRDSFDAQRIQALMVEPYSFNIGQDPLKSAPPVIAPDRSGPSWLKRKGGKRGGRSRESSVAGGGLSQTCTESADQAAVQNDGGLMSEASEATEAAAPRRSRWSRGRGRGQSNGAEVHSSAISAEADGPAGGITEAQQATDTVPSGSSRRIWRGSSTAMGRAPVVQMLLEDLCLRKGLQMPRLGLGTWQAAGDGECRHAVAAALKCGCRLIDTAAAYKNEEDVGVALRAVSRADIFLVTKLQSKEHGNRLQVLNALRASLRRLGVDYVDLYLMHSPRGGFVLETWDAMLEARSLGLTRAVGVSNFGAAQLEGLKSAGRELPEVNQIEQHVWLQQQECVTWCAQEGVTIMAYSPLARGKLFGRAGPTSLAGAAERLKCSEAQVAIRWCLAKGFVVIPKSVNPERITANLATLHMPLLPPEEMTQLEKHDRGFKSCAIASDAMDIPWNQIAESLPAGGKGKGKGSGKWKGTGKGYAKGQPVQHW